MSLCVHVHYWVTIALISVIYRRSLNILKDHFQKDVLEAQDPWRSSENYEKLLALLPDKAINDSLRRKWEAAPDRPSALKWADIDNVARTGASKSLDSRALLEAKQDIVFEYTYPRLDIEVSKKLNHLLKSPFVVHPGTGRVCVPMLIGGEGAIGVDAFNPLTVPTVLELLEEVDAWEGDKAAGIQDWQKTSLRPYVEYFGSFVRALLKDEEAVKIKQESLDF